MSAIANLEKLKYPIGKYNPPESGLLSVKYTIGLYAWHGKHHLAHITSLMERMDC